LASKVSSSASGSIPFIPSNIIFETFFCTLGPFSNYLVPEIPDLYGPVEDRQWDSAKLQWLSAQLDGGSIFAS
jgi:hypothetical protein